MVCIVAIILTVWCTDVIFKGHKICEFSCKLAEHEGRFNY